MSQATLTFEDQLRKLEDEHKNLIEKCNEVRKFVTSPDIYDHTKVESHTLENLTGELATAVITLTNESIQPVATMNLPGERGLELGEDLGSSQLGALQEKLEKSGGSDWKTKLVFIVFILGLVVAAALGGFFGPQVPMRNADGSFVTNNIYSTQNNVTSSSSVIQMVTTPLLSAQWMITIWAIAGALALVVFLPGVVGNFLDLFAKKPEDTLPPPEQLGKYLSDKINWILRRYMGLFTLEAWQPATKENLPEYYVAESPEYLYSRAAQNRLLYPKFAVTQLNEIMFVCNEYVRRQRNVLYEHIARVNSSSAPSGMAKAGA